MTEEILSELEHRSVEIIQSKKQKEKKSEVMNRTLGIYETMTTDLTFMSTRVPEGQQKVCSAGKISEEVKAKNFTNLLKDIYAQIQEVQWSRLNDGSQKTHVLILIPRT